MADLPDIHHKMSKKIAQLTKVIFLLNTKNDEASSYHRAQAEAYEREIERIVKDANSIIAKQREIMQKQKTDADLGATLHTLKTQFEEAKRRAQAEAAALNNSAQERQDQLKAEASDKLATYKRELTEVKNSFLRQINAFEGKELTSMSSLSDLKRAHRGELDAYVKTQNAKYSQLLQEKLDSEDSYENNVKRLNEDWTATLKQELERARQDVKKTGRGLLDQASTEFVRKLDSAETSAREAEAARAALETTVFSLQSEISQLNGLISEWEQKHLTLTNERQRLEAQQLTRGREASELDNELARTLSQLATLTASLEDKDRALALFTEEAKDIESQLKQELATLQTKEQLLHIELENRTAKTQSLSHELKLLQQNLSELNVNYKQLQGEFSKFQSELEFERGNKHSQGHLLANKDSEIAGLKSTIENYRAQAQDLEEAFKQEIAGLKHNHAEELAGRTQAHNAAVEQLTTDSARTHSESLEKAAQELEYCRKALTDEFTKQLQEQKTKFEQEMSELEDSLRKSIGDSMRDSMKNSLRDSMKQHEEQAAELYAELQGQIQALRTAAEQTGRELAELTQETTELKVQKEALLQENSELNATLKKLQGEIASSRQSGSEAVSSLRTEITELRREHDRVLTELQRKHREETENLQLAHSNELKSLKSEHSNETGALRKITNEDLAKSSSELQSCKAAHAAELNRIRAEQQNSEANWANKLRDYEASTGQKASNLAQQHSQELAQLGEHQKTQLTALESEHQKVLEQLKLAHESARASLLKQLEQQKQQELASQARAHEEKLQQFSNDFDKHMAQQVAAYEQRLKALQEELRSTSDLKDKENLKLEQEITELESCQKALQREIETLKSSSDAARETLVHRDAQIAQLHGTIKHNSQEFTVKVKGLEDSSRRREEDLRNSFKTERDNLIKEHLGQMEQLQCDFQTTTELMEERYCQLQRRFDELQDLYDNRPPREEDLVLITQLQQDLALKGESLRKAYEDMKFFKLELINREDNYNKMFGSNPTVGVLNPLNKKPTAKDSKLTQRVAPAPPSALVRKPTKFKE